MCCLMKRAARLFFHLQPIFFSQCLFLSAVTVQSSHFNTYTHSVNAAALTSGNIAPIYSYHAQQGNTCSHIWHLCWGLNFEFQVVLFIEESQSVDCASCSTYAVAHESLIFPVDSIFMLTFDHVAKRFKSTLNSAKLRVFLRVFNLLWSAQYQENTPKGCCW